MELLLTIICLYLVFGMFGSGFAIFHYYDNEKLDKRILYSVVGGIFFIILPGALLLGIKGYFKFCEEFLKRN